MLHDLIQHVFGDNPQAALLIILNLIFIESLLSIDNAAVLATMVMDLPKDQRSRALRIGIVFAYIFRGLCLLFASLLIKISWLKLIGALYLIYLCFTHFIYKDSLKEVTINKKKNPIYRYMIPYLGTFWSTVVMVEIMDLVFSIDNVFAAVVYAKDNIYLIWIGVFIGIITMRLVAIFFVKLIERFPLLNNAAYIVIGCLGLKLMLGFCCDVFHIPSLCAVIENDKADFIFSMFTLLVFFAPILIGYLKKKENTG
jgi:YkoY family integral membrane protein